MPAPFESYTCVCSMLTFDTRKTKSVADLRDTNSVADLSKFELPNTAVSASCICVPQPEKCKLEIVKFRAFIAIMPNSLTHAVNYTALLITNSSECDIVHIYYRNIFAGVEKYHTFSW